MAPKLLFALLFMISYCASYKILVISPLPGKSHSILGNGIVKHLINAGHQITYLTAYPKSIVHENVTIIDVSDNSGTIREDMINIKALMDKDFNIQDLSFLLNMFLSLGMKVISNKGVQELLKDKNQQFDVIIAEWMFTDIYAGLAPIYECPFIWLSTVEPHWMVLELIDEAPNPAYTPDCQTYHVPPFGLWQRVQELLFQLYGKFLQYRYVHKQEQQIYEQYLVPHIKDKTKPVPSLDVLRYNASLMLGNSHYSLGQPTRLPQNYINIAGYHIDNKIEPLPKDLQTLMDNAKDGVIYFSMGSNLKSRDFPDELKKGFLKVFGELKQTVIWKFEETNLKNRPKNVHIVNWAPQQSILAHSNCVLFITHGGLLSTTEAVHYGVPIIGIPVFADQFTNVERAVAKGFAKKVTLSYTMMENLKQEIEDIIYNSKYMEQAKYLSMIYHSRLVSPSTELVHWVEHVVKTRGALHLRSPALFVPFYQRFYLDLLAVVLVILTTLSYFGRKLFKKLTMKPKNSKKDN